MQHYIDRVLWCTWLVQTECANSVILDWIFFENKFLPTDSNTFHLTLNVSQRSTLPGIVSCEQLTECQAPTSFGDAYFIATRNGNYFECSWVCLLILVYSKIMQWLSVIFSIMVWFKQVACAGKLKQVIKSNWTDCDDRDCAHSATSLTTTEWLTVGVLMWHKCHTE